MVYIYILELEQNKYYIGKTNNPDIRLNNHFNNNGSKWTQKYKPLKVIDIIPKCCNFDEDKYTLIYMRDKGIENVRGGSYCRINLTEQEIEHINKQINTANDVCYKCGKSGHFIRDCGKQKLKCNRCKRVGHIKKDCHAKTFSNGKRIISNRYFYTYDFELDEFKVINNKKDKKKEKKYIEEQEEKNIKLIHSEELQKHIEQKNSYKNNIFRKILACLFG